MARVKSGDIVEATSSNIRWSLPNSVSHLRDATVRIKAGTRGTVITTGSSSEPGVTFDSATVAFDCGALIVEIPRVSASSLKVVTRAEDVAA